MRVCAFSTSNMRTLRNCKYRACYYRHRWIKRNELFVFQLFTALVLLEDFTSSFDEIFSFARDFTDVTMAGTYIDQISFPRELFICQMSMLWRKSSWLQRCYVLCKVISMDKNNNFLNEVFEGVKTSATGRTLRKRETEMSNRKIEK